MKIKFYILLILLLQFNAQAFARSLKCTHYESQKLFLTILDDMGSFEGCLYLEDETCTNISNNNTINYEYWYGMFIDFDHRSSDGTYIKLLATKVPNQDFMIGNAYLDKNSQVKVISFTCNEL